MCKLKRYVGPFDAELQASEEWEDYMAFDGVVSGGVDGDMFAREENSELDKARADFEHGHHVTHGLVADRETVVGVVQVDQVAKERWQPGQPDSVERDATELGRDTRKETELFCVVIGTEDQCEIFQILCMVSAP